MLLWHSIFTILACLTNIRFKRVEIAKTAQNAALGPEGEYPQEESTNTIAQELADSELVLGAGGKDEREAKQTYNEETCIICFEQKVGALLRPCNHGGVCRGCAVLNYDRWKKCPVCRQEIKDIIVYEKRKDGKLYQTGIYPEGANLL